MANKYWFPHDEDAFSDTKIVCLVDKYGALGYGVYWRIVEMLHKEPTHQLKHNTLLVLSLSIQLKIADENMIEELIDYCISKLQLFVSDGESFCSKRVNKNIEDQNKFAEERSEKARSAATIRWEKEKAKKQLEEMNSPDV